MRGPRRGAPGKWPPGEKSVAVPADGHRFHIVFALHYLRYGLLLCLVPMVQALLAFDLDSLWTALQQDAVILVLCAGAALFLWYATSFRVEKGKGGQALDTLHVSQGVFYRSRHAFTRRNIAALTIERPLHCRLLGASRVTLYFRANASPRTYSLYLRKRDAAAVADALLPVRAENSVFEPTGFERLSFVMLSANIITSTAFAVWGVRQLEDVLGQGFHQLALDSFGKLELIVARFLPTGLAFLATLGFLAMSFAFLYALLRTAGFTVCRNGGVIISSGGLVTKTERRILLACVSACDVCVTPPARLLRRYPVYLSAGSFRGGDLPVLVYKKGQEHMVERLLPNFCPPDGPLCTPARKSLPQYLWQPGTLLAFSLALCGVSSYAMPNLLPVLAVPALLSLCALLVSAEGIFREGLRKNENRTLSLCFTRFFTRHEVCVFTPDIAYTLLENPFSVSGGRCDVRVHLPCGMRYRVRGVLQYLARAIPFTL